MTLTAPMPRRAEVWIATLEPVLGHEQGGRRPCLVVSTDRFNQGPTELVVLLAITSRARPIPLYVLIQPPEGGLQHQSAIMCDQIRTAARERLLRRLGHVTASTMDAVESRLRDLLQL